MKKKIIYFLESLACYFLIIKSRKYFINCFICKKKLDNFKILRYHFFFIKYKICRKCNHLIQTPQIKNLNFYYNTIYRSFRKNNESYEMFEREKRRGNYIIDYLKKNKISCEKKNILEYGCGSGGILFQFKKMQNCQTVGFEINKRQSNFGKLFCGSEVQIIDNFDIIKSKKLYFDIIILSHSLEHFQNPDHELKKIKKYLKNGGVIYIEVPGIENPKVYKHNYTAQPGHLNIFSAKSLSNLCRNLNFDVIHINSKIQSVFRKN